MEITHPTRYLSYMLVAYQHDKQFKYKRPFPLAISSWFLDNISDSDLPAWQAP